MMENWLTVKKGSLWPPQYTYILLILALHYDARISLTKLTVMFGRLSLQTPVTDLLSPFLMEVCVAFFVCFFFCCYILFR